MLEPGLHPHDEPRPGCPPSERRVWEALRHQLPDGWYAWHSLRLRGRRGLEAEADFVLAIPGRGLLVLEVKGGAIEVRDGLWYQNGFLMRSPREQGHAFRHELSLVLERAGCPRVWVEVATVFPDTPFFDPPGQSDLAATCLGEQDLGRLGGALEALAEQLFYTPAGHRADPPEGPAWLEAIDRLWGHEWVRARRLGQRNALRQGELQRFRAEQTSLLRSVARNRRVLVLGGAGSGKTLLAMEAARLLGAEGREVGFLCFTRALAAEVARGGLRAQTVRELAAELLIGAHRSPEPDTPSEGWSSAAWERVTPEATRLLDGTGGLAGTALVVDEAQDLSWDDWRFILALSAGGPLWVFADPGQAFWPDRVRFDPPPEGFTVVELDGNERNPPALARFAEQYRGGPPAPAGEGHDGIELTLARSEHAVRGEIERHVKRALDEGVRPSDIAVLSLGGRSRTALARLAELAGVPARRADDHEAYRHLVADTFLRFKGLERPLVLVVELGLGSRSYERRMHIALTRATLQCVVIATPEEVAADPRLGALAAAGSDEAGR